MKNWKKMSKVLIPLSLISMSPAFAEYGNGNYCPPANNCCPVDCCRPCCVPQPRKCINCECYNPQFYSLQCDWGAFVTVDFLYWYARESNLEFAFRTENIGYPSASGAGALVIADIPSTHHYLKSSWDPGVRVGLGWNTDCDGWDLYLNWTWFKNCSSGSASISDADYNLDLFEGTFSPGFISENLYNPWALGGGINTAAAYSQTIKAKWSLTFNQIDLELGKRYWVSKCFTLRPFIGLRGAWTKTNFSIFGLSPGGSFSFQEGDIFATQTISDGIDDSRINNKIWGVGLLGGIQPNFRLGNWCGCGEFSIYGNVDGALIWGKYRGKNRQFHDVEVTTSFQVGTLPPVVQTVDQSIGGTASDNYARMQGILDLAIGLRWEDTYCCDRYMFSIDLGWEHHYWWDFGVYHRATAVFFDSESFAPVDIRTSFLQNQTNSTTNLGFGGLVLRARFDF